MLSRLFSTSSSGSGSGGRSNGVALKHRPLPRWGHSVAAVDGKLYLWGGCQESLPKCHSSPEKERFLSKVEVFDPQTSFWEEKPTTGSPPIGCYWNAFTTLQKSLCTFGGYCGHGKCYHNGLHQLDIGNLHWKELLATNPGDAPMKKWQCGMVSFNNDGDSYLCLFGGWGTLSSASKAMKHEFVADRANPGCVWSNELHFFNLTTGTWICPNTSGTSPPPCQGFTFTRIDAERVILFGGFQPATRRRVNDIYILHLINAHWIKLTSPLDLKVPWPCGRDDHSACVKEGNCPLLVVVGGVGNQFNTLSDMWIFDVDSQTWKQVSAPRAASGRRGHSTVVFSLGPRHFQLVICGGVSEWLMEKSHREQPMVPQTSVLELNDDGDSNWLLLDDIDNSSPLQTPTLSRSSSSLSNDVFAPYPYKPPSTPRENGFTSHNSLFLEPPPVEAKPKKKSSRLKNMTMTLDRKSAASKHFQEARKEIHRLNTELEQTNKALTLTKKTAEEAVAERDKTLKELEEMKKQLKDAQALVTATEEQAREVKAMQQSHPLSAQSPRGSPVGADASPTSPLHNHDRNRRSSRRFKPVAGQNGLQQLWLVSREEIELVSPDLYRDSWSAVRVGSFRGLKVAARRLNKGVVNDNTMPQYIQAMNTASHARHPNLVQMIAATIDPDPLILTEWMPASVRLLFRQGPLPKQQLLTIASDIASALTFLHAWRPHPIIHRDVSSSNVFLETAPSGRWKAKLSSYGTSNFFSLVSITSNTITAIKPSIFAAPEVKAPELHSPKMDTYSFGVLLLEMCQPQEGISPTAGDIQIRVSTLQWSSMADLITKCTTLAPDDRPTMLEVYKSLSSVNESFV